MHAYEAYIISKNNLSNSSFLEYSMIISMIGSKDVYKI